MGSIGFSHGARRAAGAGLVVALSVVVLSGLAGCEEKKLSGTVLRDGKENLLIATCGLFHRCCDAGEIDVLLAPFLDRANCVERMGRSTDDAWWAALALPILGGFDDLVVDLPYYTWAVKAGRLEAHDRAIDACVVHLNTLDCNQAEPLVPTCAPADTERCPALTEEERPCDPEKLFSGLVREGGACRNDLECAAGYRCYGLALGAGQEGSCVRLSKQGEFCFTHRDCAEGLYCSFGGVCTVPAKEGEPCAFLDPDDPFPNDGDQSIRCEEELHCNPFGAQGPVCVKRCQEGAACATDIDCVEGKNCVHPIYGNPQFEGDAVMPAAHGRCRDPLAEGQWCGEHADCAEGLFCRAPTWRFAYGIQAYACSKQVDTAQPCYLAPSNPTTTVLNDRTPSHEACVGGFCNGTALFNTPCTADTAATCAPGQCDLTTDPANPVCVPVCAQALPDGQACTPPGLNPQCASGFCVDNQPQPICSALFQDGGGCTADFECLSGHCVRGRCATLPLAANQPCDNDTQCSTCFCSYDAAPICKPLPLGPNELCQADVQCQTGYYCELNLGTGERRCAQALPEGATCTNDPTGKPCGTDMYCDTTPQTPLCRRLKPAGEPCAEDRECLGACETYYGQSLCSAVAATGKAVCDGQ